MANLAAFSSWNWLTSHASKLHLEQSFTLCLFVCLDMFATCELFSFNLVVNVWSYFKSFLAHNESCFVPCSYIPIVFICCSSVTSVQTYHRVWNVTPVVGCMILSKCIKCCPSCYFRLFVRTWVKWYSCLCVFVSSTSCSLLCEQEVLHNHRPYHKILLYLLNFLSFQLQPLILKTVLWLHFLFLFSCMELSNPRCDATTICIDCIGLKK